MKKKAISKNPLLSLQEMHVHYGAIHALHGINLDIFEGEMITLLGPNGAGKTTTLHAISGLIPISSGKILFEGKPLNQLPPHKIVSKGISQSPEGRMIFPQLTVTENLEMGAYLRKNDPKVPQDRDSMFSLFPRLKKENNKSQEPFLVVNSRCWPLRGPVWPTLASYS